jgi:phage terminase large subunit-like protein
VRELAETYTIAECTFDPWRFEAPALELAERGIPIVAFPQSNARMAPASGRLHAAIVEKRLQHPDDSALNAHVRAAIARDTLRGWRIDKLKSRDNIDAVVALAMAVDAAESKPAPVELLGWL